MKINQNFFYKLIVTIYLSHYLRKTLHKFLNKQIIMMLKKYNNKNNSFKW